MSVTCTTAVMCITPATQQCPYIYLQYTQLVVPEAIFRL